MRRLCWMPRTAPGYSAISLNAGSSWVHLALSPGMNKARGVLRSRVILRRRWAAAMRRLAASLMPAAPDTSSLLAEEVAPQRRNMPQIVRKTF